MYGYEEFKKGFYNISNIDLSSYKESQMKRRIDNFISKNHGGKYDEFLRAMKMDNDLKMAFITHLTINVSEFYRNPAQWKTLEKIVIPYLTKNFGRRLRIWSAACSTGDEPYTLAMVFGDYMPLSQIEIIATDMDLEVLDKAKIGLYNEKSIKGLPDKYQKRYFKKTEYNQYKIDDNLKKCITFKQHNLLKDIYPHNVDLLVCRNVMIYFTDEAKEAIYHNFSDSLKKDGILFVGSTEQILGPSQYGFDTFESFFYKKV